MSHAAITSNPIKNFEALQRQLRRLGYTSDSQIWIKVSNKKIHAAELTDSGLAVWECKKERDADGNPIPDPKGGSVWNRSKYHPNGYQYLLSLAERGEEIFFIVNHPVGGIGAGHTSKFTSIFIECDVDSIEEQWRKINWAAAEYGLVPALIVFSGGKSLHVYYNLTTEVDAETWQRLQRKAIAVFTSDPVIQNHNREMRLAGFPRVKKGNYQSLEFESETAYTPESLESILDKTGGFTHGLSKERWGEIFHFLRDRKLSHQEKEAKVREVAGLPEEELPENKRLKEVEAKRSQRRVVESLVSNNLLDAINQASVKLGPDIFDWAGHKWRWDGSSKARGCCPWHESASGSSAWISLRKNGDGWGFACLTCTDNRQINAFSYWWQLKHGLGAAYPTGKTWVEAAREFCLSAGVTLPELPPLQRWDEPDAQAYDEYLKQEAEQEHFEEGLDHYLNGKALENFLGKTLKQIKKFVSQAPKHLAVNGFQEVPAPQPNAKGIVQFKAGDREKTVSHLALQAQKEGKRAIILDNSEMGLGKSHNWGEISNGVLGIDRLFYTSVTHRNPSTATIESTFVDLPVRNAGLLSDDTKQTSLGKNHVRWAKRDKGEIPNLTGNCSRTHLFHVLSGKGYQSETSAAANVNPICKTCKFALGCSEAKDKDGKLLMQPVLGNTYRSDRQKTLANEKIRCALDSLPSLELIQEGNEKKGKPPQRVGLVIDEFHQQYRATNLSQVELDEVDSTWAYFETRPFALQQEIKEMQSLMEQKRDELGDDIEDEQQAHLLTQEILALSEDIKTNQQLIQRLPATLDVVRPIIHNLRLIIAGDLPTTQQTFYGWNENLLREELGTLPEGLTEAIEVLSALNPKLISLLDGTEADSVSQKGVEGTSKQKKESSAALNYIRKAFEKESKQQARERLKALPANWVVPVLRILNGDRGSFRVKNGTLEVVTPNERHKEQLLAADLTVILDATVTQEELAENLGIDPSEIIVIQQERQSYENLTVVQVSGMGKLTKSRSSDLTNRLDALLEELGKKHFSNAVIDHLAVKGEGHGHWFADSRGTNAYQDKTALITVGSPYQDIGSLAMVYSTMTGDKNAVKGNPRFDKFVQRFKESEVIQAGGRLRVHRRKEEKLFWYVVTDEDTSFLKAAFPGATFEQASAFSICAEAGSQTEQTFKAIIGAMKRLADEGKKITQSTIAETCDRIKTQGAVSKAFSNNEIIAKIGGWGALRKIFQALFSGLYRTRNNFSDSWKDELTQDQVWAVESYLPLIVDENPKNMEAIASACIEMSDVAGWRGIEAFFRSLPIEKAAEMFGWLIGLLSEGWRLQFVGTAIAS